MNMKPQKPIPQPKGQPQIDLKNATTMRCQKCDNPIFIQGYVIKKLSALVSPTGKEIIADISKGSYQDVLVVDKEINFIATVSNILGRI